MTALKVVRPSQTRQAAEAKHIPEDVLHGTFFERDVPLDKMFVHTRDQPGGYARPLNSVRLTKLSKEFNPKALGIILLSMRDSGMFAIIDGQHRRAAAQAAGMKSMDAYVYIDLSLEEEARLYRQFGDYLRQTARDRWFAALTERQPETLAIEAILTEYGLRVVNDTHTKGGIAAVESILFIARQYGPQILRETLHALTDAFGYEEPLAFGGQPLRGMAMFLHRVGKHPNFKRSRLIERLARMGAAKWEQQAAHVYALERGEKGTAFGKALLAIHDQGPGFKPAYRIGEWPDRVYSEEVKEAMRQNLRNIATPAATAARKAGVKQRAMEVRCRTCGARIGKPCIDEHGAAHNYVHMARSRDAAKARRDAKMAAAS